MKKYKEFINKPYLGDLNLTELKNNFDENEFGDFQDKIDRKSFDLNLSKSLYYNDEIIGGCLINILSLNDIINTVKYWVDHNLYSNYVEFITPDAINRYKDKKGVYSDFIYIKEEYRNSGLVNIILDYEISLGDYVWGINSEESIHYFITKQDRIKVISYLDEHQETNIISATKIK